METRGRQTKMAYRIKEERPAIASMATGNARVFAHHGHRRADGATRADGRSAERAEGAGEPHPHPHKMTMSAIRSLRLRTEDGDSPVLRLEELPQNVRMSCRQAPERRFAQPSAPEESVEYPFPASHEVEGALRRPQPKRAEPSLKIPHQGQDGMPRPPV